jgi:predicted Zn-dependent protease
VGRNIAAQILSMTPALNDETLVHRVNLIGQSLAMKSSRPEIYSSYSFMILDSEDPNGFATPGGHIFITKGLLDLCEDDHHIAAILAHEVGHVSAQHGSKLIKKMRYTDAALSAATELAKHSSDDTASMLSERFGDITKEVFSKVVEKGFGRAQELEADGFGVLNLKAAGFRPSAMEEMLSKIDRTFGAMDIGLFKSHPKPQDRIAHVQKVLETGDPNGKATEASAEVSENKTEEPKKKKKKRFGLF